MKSLNNKKDLVKAGSVNAITGIVFFIVNTITALILNPLLVNYFGSYYFGIWKSINQYIGFASVTNGQGIQALKWVIAHKEKSEDYAEKKRYIASAFIIWLIFVPLLCLLIGLLIYFIPEIIKGVHPSDQTLLYMIVSLLGFNLIITPLLGISEAILVGTNNGYAVNNIKTFWLILSSIIIYYIVILQYGLFELALSTVLITIFRGIHYLYITHKYIFWFGFEKPKNEEVKSLFKFSSWKLGWAFVARFLMSSEIILLSYLVSAKSVSEYIFSGYLSATGVLLSAIVTSAFNPGIGKLVGSKNYETSKIYIMNLREFVLAFGVLVGTITLILNKSFVLLWANETLYMGDFSNLLIVLIMIQLIMIRNEAFLIDLSLDIKKKVLVGSLSVILSFIFAIIGYIYSNNIHSIFIGLLIGRMLLMISFPIFTNIMINTKEKYISFKVLLGSIFLLMIAFSLGKIQVLTSWYELFMYGSLEIVLLLIIVYYLLLSNNNKLIIRSKINNIRGGRIS